jgi:DNA (cytosine-5)-methyltransferase 1
MNSLELFSGAGRLAKGLELAGFKHTALVENNKHAYASLCENCDAEKVFFGDVRDFDPVRLAEIMGHELMKTINDRNLTLNELRRYVYSS